MMVIMPGLIRPGIDLTTDTPAPTPFLTPDDNRWKMPVLRMDEDTFFSLREMPSAIYEVSVGGHVVQMLIQNRGHDTCFVGFHGSQKRSAELRPPYFYGLSLAAPLKVNTVLISDPTLLVSDTLSLGWYSGTAQFRVQEILANILRKIHFMLGKWRQYYFGPSGGGFAALYYGSVMKATRIFAMNPQITIEGYYPTAVNTYFRTGFGQTNTEAGLKIVKSHICTDIRDIWHPDVAVFYLQNTRDGHVDTHLKPFMAMLDIPYTGENIELPNFRLLMDDWGDGHQPAPKPLIATLLKDAIG